MSEQDRDFSELLKQSKRLKEEAARLLADAEKLDKMIAKARKSADEDAGHHRKDDKK